MSRLSIATKLCEPRIRSELEARGHQVADFGQGMVSEKARQLLRNAMPPDLGRWPADFRVQTSGGLPCYVDAKFHYARNRNVSIEMRSVLAARIQSVTWYYACATWDGHDFYGFKSINAGAMPLSSGCCPGCIGIFHSSRDPVEVNARLPQYCREAQRSATGSGTPYFLVLADSFPYGDLLFDRPQYQDAEMSRCHILTAGRQGCGCRTCASELQNLSADRGDRTT